jgi:hypothetical protein
MTYAAAACGEIRTAAAMSAVPRLSLAVRVLRVAARDAVSVVLSASNATRTCRVTWLVAASAVASVSAASCSG